MPPQPKPPSVGDLQGRSDFTEVFRKLAQKLLDVKFIQPPASGAEIQPSALTNSENINHTLDDDSNKARSADDHAVVSSDDSPRKEQDAEYLDHVDDVEKLNVMMEKVEVGEAKTRDDFQGSPETDQGQLSGDEHEEKRQVVHILNSSKTGKRDPKNDVNRKIENIMMNILQHFVQSESLPESSNNPIQEESVANGNAFPDADKRAIGNRLRKQGEVPYRRKQNLENLLRRLNSSAFVGTRTVETMQNVRQSVEKMLELQSDLQTLLEAERAMSQYPYGSAKLPSRVSIEGKFKYTINPETQPDGCHGLHCGATTTDYRQVIRNLHSTSGWGLIPQTSYRPKTVQPSFVLTSRVGLGGVFSNFSPSDRLPNSYFQETIKNTISRRKKPNKFESAETPSDDPREGLDFVFTTPNDPEVQSPYFTRDVRGLGKVLGGGFKLGKKNWAYYQTVAPWLPAGYRYGLLGKRAVWSETGLPTRSETGKERQDEDAEKRLFWKAIGGNPTQGATKSMVTKLSAFVQNMREYLDYLREAKSKSAYLQEREMMPRYKRDTSSLSEALPVSVESVPSPTATQSDNDAPSQGESNADLDKRVYWRRLGQKLVGYTRPVPAPPKAMVNVIKREKEERTFQHAPRRVKRAFGRLFGGYKLSLGKRGLDDYGLSSITAEVQRPLIEPGPGDVIRDSAFAKRGIVKWPRGYKLGKRDQTSYAQISDGYGDYQDVDKSPFGRLLERHYLGKRDLILTTDPDTNQIDGEELGQMALDKRAWGRLLGRYKIGKRQKIPDTVPEDFVQSNEEEGVIKRAFDRLFGGYKLDYKREKSLAADPDDYLVPLAIAVYSTGGSMHTGVKLSDNDEDDLSKRAFGRLLGGYKLGKREQAMAGNLNSFLSPESMTTGLDNYQNPEAFQFPDDADLDKRAFGRLLGGYKIGKRDGRISLFTLQSYRGMADKYREDEIRQAITEVFSGMLDNYLQLRNDFR